MYWSTQFGFSFDTEKWSPFIHNKWLQSRFITENILNSETETILVPIYLVATLFLRINPSLSLSHTYKHIQFQSVHRYSQWSWTETILNRIYSTFYTLILRRARLCNRVKWNETKQTATENKITKSSSNNNNNKSLWGTGKCDETNLSVQCNGREWMVFGRTQFIWRNHMHFKSQWFLLYRIVFVWRLSSLRSDCLSPTMFSSRFIAFSTECI